MLEIQNCYNRNTIKIAYTLLKVVLKHKNSSTVSKECVFNNLLNGALNCAFLFQRF
jgi:hypothetical protein